MQKFSEFVGEYKEWKKSAKGTSKITDKEVKNLREAYASLNSKRAKSSKPSIKEGKKSEFEKLLSDYSKYKESLSGSGEVSKSERMALRNEYLSLKESKARKSKNLQEFSDYVKSYREWKKENHGTSKLNDSEKKSLKESFFKTKKGTKLNESEAKSSVKDAKAKRFHEAIHNYAAWKQEHYGTSNLTESEKVEVKKQLVLEDVKSKLDEAKSLARTARKHMIEGDVMDAAGATQAAGESVNAADAMAGQAAMGDTMVPPQTVPQNIIDEIANIKASVDTLATEIGIQSPVDLGADPAAGIPATTGVADPNADMADMAANDPAMMNDPNASMMESTISSIKSRLAAREEKLNEGKKCCVYNAEAEAIENNSNLGKYNLSVDKANSEDTMKVPSTSELLNGTKKGPATAAATWPTSKITEPKDKKLKNIEEGIQKDVQESLDENGQFDWDNFLKVNKDRLY